MRAVRTGIVCVLMLALLLIQPVSAQDTQVNASVNDATERGNGTFSYIGVTADIYSHTDNTNINYRCAGYRFTDIQIEQGNQVENAYLEIYTANQQDINAIIYAEAVDDSLDFQALQAMIDNASRPKTENYVDWVENSIGLNDWENSDNIAALLQEVVNRPGWENGNAITIILIAKTDQNLTANTRTYDFSPALAAKLRFHWQPTVGQTIYPVRAMPGSTINIQQLLQPHGQGATDITAKITFNTENFRFLLDYPENDNIIDNCNGLDCVGAEWFVATPTIEDNYTFFVEWEFIHEDYHYEVSDNFTLEVLYFDDLTPHTIPVFPLSDDGLAISIVAIGIAIAALGLAIGRRENESNNV